ncbi:kinetochore complex Sim4 subunit Fta1-domain-containing protein [Rostrohypoxylon terebratum]|nr:kinetochore complex Sim4 subunit Fta1-domain-containing protein [Rostrohypoxylon terebratum]
MPPKKRKPARPTSPSPPPPARSPNGSETRSASPDAIDDSLTNGTDAADEPPRFFSTTFTTYRVSPLHLGAQGLPPARLELLSRRLRDVLVGDVVRGVQVGLESDGGGGGGALGRTGALYAVEWRWVDGEHILGARLGREGSVELGTATATATGHGDQTEDAKSGKRVMCIELRYENARFNALLLPDLGGDDEAGGSKKQPSWTWQGADNAASGRENEGDKKAFLHLPLLLFRMPAPLKTVLVDFISSTFDCRISPLALGTRSLISSWETWLSDNGSNNGRKALSKDVLITLGFHIEPPKQGTKATGPGGSSEGQGGDDDDGDQAQKPEQLHLGLKSIDITIPAADVHRFLRAGERLDSESPSTNTSTNANKRKATATTALSDAQQSRRRRKLAGGKDEEGWAWRARNRDGNEAQAQQIIEQPFAEALAEYLWHHLGLDMFHPGVRVLRVACDGFALSDGRLKVFPPGRHRRGGGGGDDDDDDEEESAVWKLMRGLVLRAKGRSDWSAGAIKGLAAQ